MKHSTCVGGVLSRVIALASILLSAVVTNAQSSVLVQDAELQNRANQLMGLRASEISTTRIHAQAGGEQRVQFAIDGRVETLVLEPVTIRTPGYRLIAQVGEDEYIDLEPGTDRHYLGFIEGRGATQVAATISDAGVFARIQMPDGRTAWMEPAAEHLAGTREFDRRADRWDLHVAYRSEDVLGCAGDCGVPTLQQDAEQFEAATSLAGATSSLCVAKLACDSDFEFFASRGSEKAVESRILSIVNAMNLQYIAEVGITHQVSAIIVRTVESDPYTSTNATTLINQFRDHWVAQQGGVVRDVAQLFTGKNLDGSTIGLAFQVNDSGVICNQTSGYSMVQSDFSMLFSCVTDLSAHELGHNWGANHCTASCVSTMNSSIQCANSFANSTPDSIAVITDFRDSIGCLDCGDLLTLDRTMTGELASDKFGTSVAILNDVNGDGIQDFLIGAPNNDENGSNAGKVYVFSGANGVLLWSKLGQSAGDRFGFAVAALGSRAIVGAPYNDARAPDAGRVYVYDETGAQLKVKNGQSAGDRFGWSVDGGGDINNDGAPDFLVGAPYRDKGEANVGSVHVFDGATFVQLKRLNGESKGDRFGWSVAIVGNLNLDGFADFIVGAPFNDNNGGTNAGEVYFYSGATFSKLGTKRGAKPGDQFGRAVAALGRVNGDSLDDFAVGAPYYDTNSKVNVGRLYVYSGSGFSKIWAKTGLRAGDLFGFAVSSAGDINGDGRRDVAIGAPKFNSGGGSAGRVQVRSGLNGSALQSFVGSAAGDQLGRALAGGGGLNEPFPARVLMGISLNDATGTNAGRALSYAGQTSGLAAAMMPTPSRTKTCLADVAGFDGIVDQDDLVAVLQIWAQCNSDLSANEDDDGCAMDLNDIAAVIAAWGPCGESAEY